MQVELREAARRTYLIDDFGRWDEAIHQAAEDFSWAFGRWPEVASVHPDALERFGARAAAADLRDPDGRTPETGDLDGAPLLGEFETDAYVLRFEADRRQWPVELVLWVAPDGEGPPAEDTPPPSRLSTVETSLSSPLVMRPAHTRMLVFAEQCYRCAHLETLRTCAAFPRGIPFSIAASHHDHQRPFEGDGGLRQTPAEEGQPGLRLLADWVGRQHEHPAPDGGLALPKDGWVGDDHRAPDLPAADQTRARAKDKLTRLLAELGGPEACDADALWDAFAAAYPVSRGLLEANERGGPEAGRNYVSRWLGAQRRRKRRPGRA